MTFRCYTDRLQAASPFDGSIRQLSIRHLMVWKDDGIVVWIAVCRRQQEIADRRNGDADLAQIFFSGRQRGVFFATAFWAVFTTFLTTLSSVLLPLRRALGRAEGAFASTRGLL
jgi:hypothetical protein